MDKLIFSQTVEGIFRALGPRLDAELSARLKAIGVDPDRALRPAYPLDVFRQVMALSAAALFPELDAHQRMVALGRAFIDGYSQTMVGRAMVGMMRVIGPRRTLERLSRQFRTGNNFSETRLTDVGSPGATAFELWCNQVQEGGWYQGLVERGLELAGAGHPQAELIRREDDGATYRVTWDSP